MKLSPFAKWSFGALVAVAVLALLRLHPWQRSSGTASRGPVRSESVV